MLLQLKLFSPIYYNNIIVTDLSYMHHVQAGGATICCKVSVGASWYTQVFDVLHPVIRASRDGYLFLGCVSGTLDLFSQNLS